MDRELTEDELRRIHGFILEIAESKLPKSVDVKDLVQEVWIRVWLSQKQLRDESKLFAWVACITLNEIAKFYKKWYRKNNLTVELSETLPDSGPLKQIEDVEFDILIKEVLTYDEYLVSALLLQGYMQEDIKEKLGIPLGTVKTRAGRVKRKLAAVLTP